MFSLQGKVALVTGAAYGIGFAIAECYAKAGARVVFNCRSRAHLEQALEEYKAKGIEAKGYLCDVTDDRQVGDMVADIEKELGSVDILVNNAGITRDNLLMKMTEEDFSAVIDTNLKGTFYTMRFVSRQMLKQRSGRIINIASVVGVTGNAGQVNYAASKAGVIGMTKTAARELAGRGITVNAVAPGFIETDMTKKLSERVRETVIGQIPLGRFGSPEHVAKAVGFLASDDAEYITGQVIHVDGGMVM